jgi:hypothetical protein
MSQFIVHTQPSTKNLRPKLQQSVVIAINCCIKEIGKPFKMRARLKKKRREKEIPKRRF